MALGFAAITGLSASVSLTIGALWVAVVGIALACVLPLCVASKRGDDAAATESGADELYARLAELDSVHSASGKPFYPTANAPYELAQELADAVDTDVTA